jgi:hypothetical protein
MDKARNSPELLPQPSFDIISVDEYEEALENRVLGQDLDVLQSYQYLARTKGLACKAISVSAGIQFTEINPNKISLANLVLKDQDLQDIPRHIYTGVLVNSLWIPSSKHPLIVQRGVFRAKVIQGFFIVDDDGSNELADIHEDIKTGKRA